MTVDVRVRHCTLTIRRRDGWSWGAGPQPHIEAALTGVEAAVEAAIAEAGVVAGVDAHLDEPVRLELGSDGVVTAASRNALVERLRALPDAPSAAGEPRGRDAAAAGAPPGGGEGTAGEPPAEHPGGALARTLARWSRGGQMERVVSAWPATLVRAWIEAVASAARSPGAAVAGAPAPLTAQAVDLIAEGVLGATPPDPSGREAGDRLLVLLAAIAAALGDRLPDGATQALARQRAGVGDEPVAGAPRAAAPRAGAASPSPAPAPGRQPAPLLEQVVPALPLLVLAQLARIGYVDAIVSAAAAAGLPGAAGALGAAVAGKVLSPPGRGWRREPAEAAVVALASGGPPERVSEGLAAIAGRAHDLLAPLASSLQAAYADGRSAKDEMLVWAGEEGIICGEEEGLLPAAWVASEPELEVALASLGRPPVRRGDGFAALARALHERPGLPRGDAPALERQLAAAAGTTLGLIALALWGSAGQAVSPLLALERLGDLEARVRAGRDGLLVSIPRGRRWLDLRRGGLLELFAIPWLPAGRLEVGTW